MSPALGNGFESNSAFPDNGQVVNVSFIPATRLVIVTWNLPALARATANLNVSFDVTYYSVADPMNTISVTASFFCRYHDSRQSIARLSDCSTVY